MAAFEGYAAAMKQGGWQLAATCTMEGAAQEMLGGGHQLMSTSRFRRPGAS